ncbi:DUF721 domain-containing protein [Nitrospira sp. Kam-Ns4a]
MRCGSFFHSVTSILQDLVHRYGIETKLLERRLRRCWPEIAGEVIAAHTRPDQIRYRKLYLLADSSAWLQHLTFLKPALIEKVNATAGSPVVTDLVLRVGEVEQVELPKAPAASEGGAEEAGLTPEALAEAEARAAAVTDPELRTRLTALMAKALGPRSSRDQRSVPSSQRPP